MTWNSATKRSAGLLCAVVAVSAIAAGAAYGSVPNPLTIEVPFVGTKAIHLEMSLSDDDPATPDPPPVVVDQEGVSNLSFTVWWESTFLPVVADNPGCGEALLSQTVSFTAAPDGALEVGATATWTTHDAYGNPPQDQSKTVFMDASSEGGAIDPKNVVLYLCVHEDSSGGSPPEEDPTGDDPTGDHATGDDPTPAEPPEREDPPRPSPPPADPAGAQGSGEEASEQVPNDEGEAHQPSAERTPAEQRSREQQLP